MKYKQNGPYGCGLYAVANSCNLDNFVTQERIEQSKLHGNTIGQLSKWMQEDGINFYIEVLYYNHLGKKLPLSALGYKPEGEVSFLPVLIVCRTGENHKNHMIGGKIDKNGVLYLYDSLQKEVQETTLKEVNKKYHHVYGLFIFASPDTGDYAFI